MHSPITAVQHHYQPHSSLPPQHHSPSHLSTLSPSSSIVPPASASQPLVDGVDADDCNVEKLSTLLYSLHNKSSSTFSSPSQSSTQLSSSFSTRRTRSPQSTSGCSPALTDRCSSTVSMPSSAGTAKRTLFRAEHDAQNCVSPLASAISSSPGFPLSSSSQQRRPSVPQPPLPQPPLNKRTSSAYVYTIKTDDVHVVSPRPHLIPVPSSTQRPLSYESHRNALLTRCTSEIPGSGATASGPERTYSAGPCITPRLTSSAVKASHLAATSESLATAATHLAYAHHPSTPITEAPAYHALKLECINSKLEGVHAISCDTVAHLLDSTYRQQMGFDKVHVVDCRFPYEVSVVRIAQPCSAGDCTCANTFPP